MRFPLVYEGPLPSSGNGNDEFPRPSKLKAIWAIRDSVNRQLHRLVETHPGLSGRSGSSRAFRHSLIPPYMVEGFRFFPIARPGFHIKCGLKIDLMVNHDLVSVLKKNGDIDNRIKTLFDGLRAPTSLQEIKNYVSPVDLIKNEYICLLQDDALITSLQIETMRNLAAPDGVGNDYVRANIGVLLEPTEPNAINEIFQID